jgi:hypothetical protein
MQERRLEPRMLCADLVDVKWRDTGGEDRMTVANLEDISVTGACLQLDDPIPLHVNVRITHPKGELQGRVRYCVYRDIGYFLGVQFDADSQWERKDFRPQHMFDPRRLMTPIGIVAADVTHG